VALPVSATVHPADVSADLACAASPLMWVAFKTTTGSRTAEADALAEGAAVAETVDGTTAADDGAAEVAGALLAADGDAEAFGLGDGCGCALGDAVCAVTEGRLDS
jgi:hypothetical protein